VAQSKSKRKKIVLSILILIGIAFLIRFVFFKKKFNYAGTLEATKVDISAQIPSRIQEVGVQEGDHIQLNQKLVSLSCEDVRIASDLAKENYDRTLRLYRSGTTSKEALDQVKNRKDDMDVKMGWCEIQSPIQGVVLSRFHEPGEWVGTGTKLLTLANIKDIWAYIYVAQPDIFRLKPGMKLVARLPELEKRRFEGKILKINEEAEFTPKNVQTRSERQRLVFGIKVSFLGFNEDEVLKPGMTIEVELPGDQ
jgi:HlyD family secretion protein